MQKKYTPQAERVLELAAKLSKKLRHNYIGTEHILAGLIQEGAGVASQVLADSHMDGKKLLELIEELVAPGERAALMEADGYTPRAQRALDVAEKEAEHFGSAEVGTEHLLLALLKELPDFDYLTINGSLPPGIEESFYDEILEVCAQRGAQVVLDISSKRMPELLRYKPLLIKPNDEEVGEIWGRSLNSLEDVEETMALLHRQGAQNVLLTLGDKGMLFSDGKELWFCDAPKVKLVSSACAGDSCLAAFLSEWLSGGGLEAAMKKGSATGADVAGSNGIGDLLRVSEYMQSLTARKVR